MDIALLILGLFVVFVVAQVALILGGFKINKIVRNHENTVFSGKVAVNVNTGDGMTLLDMWDAFGDVYLRNLWYDSLPASAKAELNKQRGV